MKYISLEILFVIFMLGLALYLSHSRPNPKNDFKPLPQTMEEMKDPPQGNYVGLEGKG